MYPFDPKTGTLLERHPSLLLPRCCCNHFRRHSVRQRVLEELLCACQLHRLLDPSPPLYRYFLQLRCRFLLSRPTPPPRRRQKNRPSWPKRFLLLLRMVCRPPTRLLHFRRFPVWLAEALPAAPLGAVSTLFRSSLVVQPRSLRTCSRRDRCFVAKVRSNRSSDVTKDPMSGFFRIGAVLAPRTTLVAACLTLTALGNCPVAESFAAPPTPPLQ